MSAEQYPSGWAAIDPDEIEALRARMRDTPAVGDRYRAANEICWEVEGVCAAFVLVRTPVVPGPGGVAALHWPGWRDTIDRCTPLAPRGARPASEER